MIKRTARWIDNRLGSSAFVEESINKVFPDHWSFMLGEIVLYSFLVLVITGVFLTFFFDASLAETVYEGAYDPLVGVSMTEAYRSTLDISFEVRAGLVMRQMHHWAALIFLAAMVLHLCRIFFTGAFRKPREINWMIGVTLLLLGIFNGFAGYSLPDDLLSGTGLRIAHSVALSIPLIGEWVAFLAFGGEFQSSAIIGRLFAAHILLVPAAIAALIGAHLAILWRQKHTQFAEAGRRETNVVGSKLWPTYAAKSLGLFFAVAAVCAALGGLVQINPVWLYGPFEPQQVTSPAQPDWYMGWVEGALRVFPAWEIRAFGYEIPNPFFPAVLLPGATFTLLYLWPFIEARFTRDYEAHHLLDRARDRPLRTALGCATLTFYIVLFTAASNDLLAKWSRIPVESFTWAFRISLLVLPPLVGFVVHRLMRALKQSRAERLSRVSAASLRHASD
ncbi:MAG: cytochrome bc1 complex cytochrome b subunit [Actinomycetota bacterium]